MLFEICKASDPYGEEIPYKHAILGWIEECGIRHYIIEVADLDALLRIKEEARKSIIISKRLGANNERPAMCITIYDDYIE
jgi:hypothetical protein